MTTILLFGLAIYFGCSLCALTAWIVYSIFCRKKRLCKDEDCPVRGYCHKTALTEKEIAELKELLEEYRARRNK